MADLVVDKLTQLFEASSTEKEITLKKDRLYSFFHVGKDSAGSAATDDIFLSFGTDAVVTTYANGEKSVLQSGKSVPIPPGTTRVNVKTAANANSFLIFSSARGGSRNASLVE